MHVGVLFFFCRRWSPFNLSRLRVSLSLPLSCSYMSIVESLPTYGVHYYAVKVQFYCPGRLSRTPTPTPHVHTKRAGETFDFLAGPSLGVARRDCAFTVSLSVPSACASLPESAFGLTLQDKQGIPWWLGLSYKGIFQYDHQDKVKPRKVRWRFL